MNSRRLYRRLWPRIQRALRVREAPVPVEMTDWCTYTIEWGIETVQFSVTGADQGRTVPVLHALSPGGPLGFVMWLDNQYLVITPWGRLAWGLLDVKGRQWMEVDDLTLESL